MAGRASGAFVLRPEVGAPRTLVGRPDAVAPVIAVGKASAGKANDRRLDLPHLVDQLFADAIHVWDFRLLAHPDAVVDHAAEIFGEVPVDVGRDRSQRLAQKNLDPRVVCAGGGGGKGRNPAEPDVTRARRAVADELLCVRSSPQPPVTIPIE